MEYGVNQVSRKDKNVDVPLSELKSLDGFKHRLQVALLVLENRRRQFLLDERNVIQNHSVGRRDVTRLQQRLLTFTQLGTLVVGAGEVHQHLRVVMLEELLHTVLILIAQTTNPLSDKLILKYTC